MQNYAIVLQGKKVFAGPLKECIRQVLRVENLLEEEPTTIEQLVQLGYSIEPNHPSYQDQPNA